MIAGRIPLIERSVDSGFARRLIQFDLICLPLPPSNRFCHSRISRQTFLHGIKLTATFADSSRISGFLAQAEVALRAQPGDGLILLLATTAALLDHNPARARVFLKRFSKRYVAIASYQLLRALVLAEENKLGPARAVLEDHKLTSSLGPAGPSRRLDPASLAL